MYRYFKLFLILILFCFIVFGKAEAEEVLTWGGCIKEAAKNHPDLIAAQEEEVLLVVGLVEIGAFEQDVEHGLHAGLLLL